MRLRGQVTDYGDLIEHVEWIVKGRHLNLIFHLGHPVDTTAADRVSTRAPLPPFGKADLMADLQADKKLPLSGGFTDEVGNPVPATGNPTYTVDNSSVINLIENGDGTAWAASTGVLGSAIVHAEVDLNGQTATADLLINVVPGDAARFEIVAGEPEEVTPDDVPVP